MSEPSARVVPTCFQELILTLQDYWARQGCLILQPFDMEMGAGTFHPATTLSVYIWKLNSEGLGDFATQVADTGAAVLVGMVLLFNLGARGLGRALQRRTIGA